MRMADADDTAASEAARELARARWGSGAVVRAALVVLSRADELPGGIRASLHEVTAPGEAADGDS